MQPTTYVALFAISFLLLTGCATPEQPATSEATPELTAPALEEAWRVDTGLDRPESAIYDAGRAAIYVTNLVGAADAMDGNGYIAKVSPDGQMMDQNWITGLNAPKGIALAGNRLWASDINALVEIDLDAGAIVGRYEVTGDAFLNDVTVHPDGSVFVTDSRFSKIYRYTDGALSVWLEDGQIQMPNGAHVIGDELVVVAGDSTAENPGMSRYFQAISFADQSIRTLDGSAPDGALDAVEPDEKGGVFTTDWSSGRLMYFIEGSGSTVLQQLGQGSADVDYIADENMLYVPVMQEGQLIAYHVQ